MKRKIRTIFFMFSLVVLAFLGVASGAPLPFLQGTVTPTPKLKAAAASLESQAGHSDGILVMGILLFVIIAVPILLRYRNLKTHPDAPR